MKNTTDESRSRDRGAGLDKAILISYIQRRIEKEEQERNLRLSLLADFDTPQTHLKSRDEKKRKYTLDQTNSHTTEASAEV